MKIPLKYGLLTALALIAWVLVTRALITNPQSIVHQLGGPVFFNVMQFVMIFLGVKALEREKGYEPTFKEAVKTGVSISFVYALTASLFFVMALFIIGTGWLASEPGAATSSIKIVAAKAFAGLFLWTMIFGLFYSAVISFFLARRLSA